MDVAKFGKLLARVGLLLVLLMGGLWLAQYFSITGQDTLAIIERDNMFGCFTQWNYGATGLCPAGSLFMPALWGGLVLNVLGTLLAKSAK